MKEGDNTEDGKFYRVTSRYFCAGFETRQGTVIHTAPILRKHFLGLKMKAVQEKCKFKGWKLECYNGEGTGVYPMRTL